MIPGLDAGVAVGDQPAKRGVPVAVGKGARGQHDRGGGVVDPGRVAGGDGAVFGEGWLELGQVAGGDVGPDVLVGVDGDGALAALDLDRNDLLLEIPRLGGGGGAVVALGGQRVLVGAGNAEVVGDVFGGDAHVAVVERVGQRADHGVDGLAVLHPLAPAQAGQPVLAAAHRLGPAGHGGVAVAEGDRLRGGHDRLQPAAAQPVQRERRCFDRQAAVDRRDPGQVHVPDLGVDHVAEYRVPDLARLHPGPADRLAHHGGAEVTGRHRGQPATVLADRGPHGGQDEYVTLVVIHGSSAHMSRPPLTAQICPVI
jgi:hypothetical protein